MPAYYSAAAAASSQSLTANADRVNLEGAAVPRCQPAGVPGLLGVPEVGRHVAALLALLALAPGHLLEVAVLVAAHRQVQDQVERPVEGRVGPAAGVGVLVRRPPWPVWPIAERCFPETVAEPVAQV
eukprot:CAMPEP_0194583712 /NCGR_PEP_ID=MMETSP0292-20121207/16542_1 /TAXON_ID=39354 /ORGANISM="Heterosigma akashiwo, Strain CCMP2393" /LENGTH=126 /DNA_ID=CAMNT_0039438465 /DNA_START=361 /DNA_END=742 /DNA_ORIENTATION=-